MCKLLLLAVALATLWGVQAGSTRVKPTLFRPTKPVRGARLPAGKATTYSLPACADRLSWCASWRTKGYCDPKWSHQGLPVASHWCTSTCGNCGTCSDRLSWCATWKSAGHCGPRWAYQNQAVGSYWCPSSCGQCNCGSSGKDPPPSTNADWQVTLLNLVNQARSGVGAPALCLNSRLTSAAQAHSQDQANRRSMTHTGGDGSDLGKRATRAGCAFSTLGENVAWNYADAAAVFKGWWGSAGHKANILNASLRHMGAGRAESNGPYWTQLFGASNSQGCS